MANVPGYVHYHTWGFLGQDINAAKDSLVQAWSFLSNMLKAISAKLAYCLWDLKFSAKFYNKK